MAIELSTIRAEFPSLRQEGAFIYLDNAATTQKPKIVIDALKDFYTSSCANVHRGVHALGDKATQLYDESRKTVAKYIGAKAHEIIFVRNTTEAINLVAKTWGEEYCTEKDTIVLTEAEHHSNCIPWLQLKKKTGVNLAWVPVDTSGIPQWKMLEEILEEKKVALVSVSGLSNVTGHKTPLYEIIPRIHAHGAKVLVDGAQLIAHEEVDVQKLDCDFFAFSGHKVYGPMGIGVLYGKEKILDAMPTFLGGGDMVGRVDKEQFSSAELPRKFEAGTPSIADAIGLKSALEWVQKTGVKNIVSHGGHLIKFALKELCTIPTLRILGDQEAKNHHSCISFTIDGIHPHDLSALLGEKNIFLRAGHHCCQILHNALGINATTRLSIATYNTKDEIHLCAKEIKQIIPILQR